MDQRLTDMHLIIKRKHERISLFSTIEGVNCT